MKKAIIFCIFFLASGAAAYCAPASRIELNDGSVINGEVTSFSNGTYVVNSSALGQISINAANISRIETLGEGQSGAQTNFTAPPGGISQAQINAYKEKIMSNPDNAAVVNSLTNNTQIREMARDPEIMNAAKAGDIQSLMKNEKFQDIVNNPDIQKAIKKIKQSGGS